MSLDFIDDESTSVQEMDSPHKGQWGGALMFSLICAWTNNIRDADDLGRHGAHNVVIMMVCTLYDMHCVFLIVGIGLAVLIFVKWSLWRDNQSMYLEVADRNFKPD